MLMSRVALQLAPAVQAATTRSGVAAPFQVISCTWVARHSDAQRGGLRRESHAKHGPVPTKNQCTKHPSAQSACAQRQKEASTTNTRLLSRHTRGEVNPERGRRADGTNTRLLGRHTRGTNPRAEASGRTTTCVRRATKPHEATRQCEAGERACTSLGCRLCRGRGSRAARPWLWCLAPCRLTTETPRPYEDLTRPYVHPDHTRVCASP